jgi:hypothetical protein
MQSWATAAFAEICCHEVPLMLESIAARFGSREFRLLYLDQRPGKAFSSSVVLNPLCGEFYEP